MAPKSSKRGSSGKLVELSSEYPPGHPMRKMMDDLQKNIDKMKIDVNKREAFRDKYISTCAYCKKTDAENCQACGRCRAVFYCCKEHQKLHYKAQHKRDCLDFKVIPFAWTFDTVPRTGQKYAPCPVLGVGHDKNHGVGVWVGTSGDISGSLQHSFEHEVDTIRLDAIHEQLSPEFQAWANLDKMGTKEARKKMGSTLLTLKIMIQNRRTDGKDVVILGGRATMMCAARYAEHALPGDNVEVDNSMHGRKMAMVDIWKDYRGRRRINILEINGVVRPMPKRSDDEKYDKHAPPLEAPRPTEAPWHKVLNWDYGIVKLSPGDYVVSVAQFRMGDGDTEKYEYQALCGSLAMMNVAILPHLYPEVDPNNGTMLMMASMNPSKISLNPRLVAVFERSMIEDAYEADPHGEGWLPRWKGAKGQKGLVNSLLTDDTMRPMLEMLGASLDEDGKKQLQERTKKLIGKELPFI